MTDLNPVDAMTTDYRALCAELAQEVEHLWSIVRDDNNESHSLAVCARALLAQPVAEGPTDEELLKLIPQALDDSLSGASRAMFQNSLSSASGIYKAFITLELRFARAVLAKWGHQ